MLSAEADRTSGENQQHLVGQTFDEDVEFFDNGGE
jgi:hypothetical protein